MPDLDIGFDASSSPTDASPWFKVAADMKATSKSMEKAAESLTAKTRQGGKAHRDAAKDLEQEARARRMAVDLMGKHGLSMQSASKISRKLKGDTSKLTTGVLASAQAYDRADKELRGLAKAQRQAGGGMSFVKRQALGLTASMTGVLAGVLSVHKALELIADAPQAAFALRGIQKALEASTGSPSAAAEEYAFLRGEVDRLGLVLPDAGLAFAKLAAAAKDSKLEGEGAREVFSAVASAAVDLNLSADDTSGILRQLGQSVSKGRVQMEELSNIAERLPGSLQAMARGLGISTREMTDMMQRGTLLAEDALPALAKALRETFGNNIDQDRANLGRLKTASFEFKAALGDGLVPALSEVSQSMAGWLKDNEDAARSVGQLIGSTLVGLADMLALAANNWHLLAGATVAVKWTAIATGIRAVTAAAMANPLIATGAAVAAGILAVNEAFKALSRSSGKAIAEIAAESDELLGAWRDLEKEIASGDFAALEDRLQHLTTEWVRATEAVELQRAELERLAKTYAEAGGATADQVEQLNAYKLSIGKSEAGLKQLELMLGRVTDAVNDANRPIAKHTDEVDKATAAHRNLETQLRDTASIAIDFGVDSETATAAQKLLADGVAGSREQAVLLAQGISSLRQSLQEHDTALENSKIAVGGLVAEQAELVRLMIETRATSSAVKSAMQLMADGFNGTFQEALALTKQLELMANVASAIDGTRRLEFLPAGTDFKPLDPRALVPDPEKVDSSGFSEANAELGAIVDTISTLGDVFDRIGGKFGDLLSRLSDAFTRIFSSVAALSGGSLDSAGSYLDAFGTIGEVFKIFTAVYDIATQLIEEGRLNNFALPIEAGISGGTRTGFAAVGDSAAISQFQASKLTESMHNAFDALEVAVGSLLVSLDTIGIEIRNDAEEISLLVGGVVFGVFDTIEEALEVGLEVAARSATFSEELGENLAKVLEGAPSLGIEAITNLIPEIAKLDGALQGLTRSESTALLAARQRTVLLDQETDLMIRAGLEVSQVLAWREAELEAMQRSVDLQGLSVAGINTGIGALQAYQDAQLAAATAAEEAAARTQQVVEAAQATATTLATGPGGLGPGSGPGGGGGGGGPGGARDGTLIGGGSLGNSNTAQVLEGIEDDWNRVGTAMRSVQGGLEDTAKSAEELGQALEQDLLSIVTEIVSAQTQADFFGQLLAFQDQYGVRLEGTLGLSQQQAQLMFEAERLRLITLALEITAQREILNLTNAQVAQIQGLAAALQDATFSGGGGGRRNRGARARRIEAADDFRESSARLAEVLAGASAGALDYADTVEAWTDKAEEARITGEELTETIRMLAELHLADISEDFAESTRQLGEMDLQTTIRHLRERVTEALAAALAAAADAPEAYAAARAAIEANLEAELREIGQQGLAGLGGVTSSTAAATEETARAIGFLNRNLEELGLTAEQVALAVAESTLPSLLRIIADAAEASGDEEIAAAAATRLHQLEMAFKRIEFEALVTILAAAGLVDEELRTLINRGRQALRELETLPPDPGNEIDDLSLSLGGLVGDIQSLATAANVDLPVEMVLAFAQAQFELAKAELLAALATEQAAAIFTQAGLDIAATVAFVAGLEFTPPTAAPGGSIGGRRSKGGGGVTTESAGRTLAEIIEDLQRRAMSPMELLRDDFLKIMEEISTASGSAAERALAAKLAEEEFARARQDLLDQQNASMEQLLRDLTGGELSGRGSEVRLQEQLGSLQSLAAAAMSGDDDAREIFADRAREVISLIDQARGGRSNALLREQVVGLLTSVLAANGSTSIPAGALGAIGSEIAAGGGPAPVGPLPGITSGSGITVDMSPIISELRVHGDRLAATMAAVSSRELGEASDNTDAIVDAVSRSQGASTASGFPTGERA